MRAETLDPIAALLRQVDAEAWVGEDGLVQRVTYTYTLGARMGGGTMFTTIDFSEYGAPMDLGIPPDADVTPVEDLDTP